jgi:hypothetical protein
MQDDDIGTLPAGGQITFARRARNSKIITVKAVNGANSRRSIAGFREHMPWYSTSYRTQIDGS